MVVSVHKWFGLAGFSLLGWKHNDGTKNDDNNASVTLKYSAVSGANTTKKHSLFSTISNKTNDREITVTVFPPMG